MESERSLNNQFTARIYPNQPLFGGHFLNGPGATANGQQYNAVVTLFGIAVANIKFDWYWHLPGAALWSKMMR